MKIYQLHKTGGEYEDYYDYIIGSYLRKEKAEEEKFKAEAEEKVAQQQSEKCNSCPYIEEHWNIDYALTTYPDYCNNAHLTCNEYGIDCENYYSHWDDSYFEIKEVEVEE